MGPNTGWAAWHPCSLHRTALLHLNLKLQASFQSVAVWLSKYVPPACVVHCLNIEDQVNKYLGHKCIVTVSFGTWVVYAIRLACKPNLLGSQSRAILLTWTFSKRELAFKASLCQAHQAWHALNPLSIIAMSTSEVLALCPLSLDHKQPPVRVSGFITAFCGGCSCTFSVWEKSRFHTWEQASILKLRSISFPLYPPRSQHTLLRCLLAEQVYSS